MRSDARLAIRGVGGVLVSAAVILGGCAVAPPRSGSAGSAGSVPSATPGSGTSPTAGSSSVAATFRPLSTEEQAYAAAFAALADEHNRAVTELLIANPLAEWDLVGVPLAARIVAMPDRLAALPAPPLAQDLVAELASAIMATGARLTAIDPHAPRVTQATAYGQALDDWAAHVLPVDLELRVRLGLPAPASGDLRL